MGKEGDSSKVLSRRAQHHIWRGGTDVSDTDIEHIGRVK